MHKIKSNFWWIVWDVALLTVCGVCLFVQMMCSPTTSEAWAVTGCIILNLALQEIHLKNRLLAAKDEIIREHERITNNLTWNVIRAHKNRETS
jgi:hypothetical protein